MKNSNKQHILVRYLIVIGMILLLATMIVYNMVNISVVHAQQWNDKADSILTRETKLEPERGKILSDNGSVLAANLNFYTARIDWKVERFKEKEFKENLDALCDSLEAFMPSKRTAAEWKKELTEQFEAKKSSVYPLFTGLTHSQFVRLKSFPFLELNRNYNGFYSDPYVKRVKPFGSMAARSIGNISEEVLHEGQHGRSGLEMALDSLLYGVPGVNRRIQLTNKIVDWESTPAVPGYDITTTINVQMQDIVENELYKICKETDAEWGTCVLMEVATGEIKAISNLERDGGDYYEGVNNAVLGYEPGSVMKPISMMVALEDGIVGDINTPIPTGSVWSEYEIYDPHGASALSPRQIIEMSSNIGMAKLIVKKYGSNPGGFRERLEQLGFFEPFNSGIGGEQEPIIAKLGNTKADKVALTRMAYGYTTLIPPLHTLAIYNAIANDGKYVRPHLVKKLSRPGSNVDSIVPVTYIRQQVCSPENAEKLRTMLHDVVWGSRGTARKWVQDENVEIAGKTGTAYTVRRDGTYSEQKRLAFCGFFPYKAPQYSCIVLMLGANRGAAASSGMVLRNVAAKMYARGLLGANDNLDDSSTPKREAKSKTAYEKVPTLYSTNNISRIDKVKSYIGSPNAKIFSSKPQGTSGVPDVHGMNIREAVYCLEKVGLNVRFKGAGRVVGQSLSAGSSFNRGALITLALSS
ncbi:MAG: transpeptidase family protein [Muribaculaceae bacterium]|nr:transpeptidase family protein [Muribaculaceae bacterium]